MAHTPGWEKTSYPTLDRWTAWYRGEETTTYVVKYHNDPSYYVYVKDRYAGAEPSLAKAKVHASRRAKFKADTECRAPSWDDLTQPSTNELCTPKGHIRIKPLGKGAFSRVGRVVRKDQRPGTTVLAITKASGADKDVMEMAYDYAGPLGRAGLPKVTKLGHTRTATVYKMPFYRAVDKTQTPRAYGEMLALQRAMKRVQARPKNRETGYQFNLRVLDEVRAERAAGKLSAATVRSLERVVETAANWGSQMTLEVPKRNLAVSATGDRLKLLDPIYDSEELQRNRERARRKAAFGARKGWW